MFHEVTVEGPWQNYTHLVHSQGRSQELEMGGAKLLGEGSGAKPW